VEGSWPVQSEQIADAADSDLQRGSEFFIRDGKLQITLSTGSGIMYFGEN
jgi:hypothetical protein